MIPRRLIAIVLLAFAFSASDAAPLTVAVASNFSRAAHELAARFEAASGSPARITTASTGKHYVQIENGAPFDILLAADVESPKLLEQSGIGVAGSRYTYAIGALVLWSRDEDLSADGCRAALEDLGKDKLAIANPNAAPYGAAAKEFLQAADLWETVRPNLVYGENIAQTLHFVVSGNASLGLIARSQAVDKRLPDSTCYWSVPESMHKPIEQQAILLQRAAENEVALDFLGFLGSSAARQIISKHGYTVPQ
jgi:molybdate transport system substrate-binding protein